MEEFVNENAARLLRSKDKDAGRITRIGIAAVDVERRDGLAGSGRKLPERRMGAQENAIGLAIVALKQLQNDRPQVPRNLVDLSPIGQQSHHCAEAARVRFDHGVNATCLIESPEMLLRKNLIKVGR